MSNSRNRTPVPASTVATEGAPLATDSTLDSAAAEAADTAEAAQAEAGDTADAASEEAVAAPVIEGRVLSAFEDYLPNDVDSWPVDDAEALEKGGFIDTHAKAVAYAKSLKEG
ncbi:MAG: hypothetical protein U9R64_08970 [Pseudomonadota bacterium]|nr:hypothetical protein [Pseudomonadota bacterium]